MNRIHRPLFHLRGHLIRKTILILTINTKNSEMEFIPVIFVILCLLQFLLYWNVLVHMLRNIPKRPNVHKSIPLTDCRFQNGDLLFEKKSNLAHTIIQIFTGNCYFVFRQRSADRQNKLVCSCRCGGKGRCQ